MTASFDDPARPIVEPITQADLPALADLHLQAFGPESWDETGLAEVLAMRGARGLVARSADDNARPLGFILYQIQFEDAEVHTLAVAPAARRQGIGSLLVGACMLDAARADARQILLEVAEDNRAGRQLYAALGFKSEGKRVDYYRRDGNRRITALLLRRVIARGPAFDP